jgi:hypothetical protein
VHFSLLQNGLERNSESMLLFLFHCRKFRGFFSSMEWFGTEFREFSVPRKSRNSDGTNQFIVPSFRLPRKLPTLLPTLSICITHYLQNIKLNTCLFLLVMNLLLNLFKGTHMTEIYLVDYLHVMRNAQTGVVVVFTGT